MTAVALSQDTIYTAIIHAADGIRFVATANCPQHLTRQIVQYVSERCAHALWPEFASEVRALIHADKPYAAIALYFDRVGDRWDDERLELGGISL